MQLAITPLYAAALGLMLIGLSIMVTVRRAKTGIGLLDGGNIALAEHIRRHGNFIENVPMALILLALAELMGAPGPLLHVAGAVLVASRVVHPMGLYHADNKAFVLRVIGGIGTWVAILLPVGYILWSSL